MLPRVQVHAWQRDAAQGLFLAAAPCPCLRGGGQRPLRARTWSQVADASTTPASGIRWPVLRLEGRAMAGMPTSLVAAVSPGVHRQQYRCCTLAECRRYLDPMDGGTAFRRLHGCLSASGQLDASLHPNSAMRLVAASRPQGVDLHAGFSRCSPRLSGTSTPRPGPLAGARRAHVAD